MRLDDQLRQVHDQLAAAAALGDDRTREIAATLATAAAPAVRLAVLSALSAAADEITAALLDHPGSPVVGVRLVDDEVRIGVETTGTPGPVTAEPRADDGDATARISLRLSDALKSEIDDAATRDGVSVNTWLVRAASAALRPAPGGPFGAGDPSAAFGAFAGRGGHPWSGGQGGPARGRQQRVTGWVDG